MERSVLAGPRNVHWASELHSEYRSTYKWHEYKEQQAQGVVKQPAPTPPNVLPLTRGPMEPAMPRRKKYPGVAYKTNELFDPAPADDIRPQHSSGGAGFDRARSAQRNAEGAGRRSKSEGPRQPRWTDTVEPKATTAMGEVMATKEPENVSTEYRNQFAWPKEEPVPRKSISMGALKKAAVAEGSVEAEPLMNHVDGDHDDKRYIEDYLWNGQKPGVQRAMPRDEKDGKDSKGHSPKKYRSFRSAPHQSIHAKLQEAKALERSPQKSPQKQRKKLHGHSFDEGATHDGAKTGENALFKSPRRRPRSADPAPAHAKLVPNGHEPPRPIKPTDDEMIPSHRSASVAKDHFFDDSPVVKSPPEPTRVKSPEQLNMRSPDPVNWTVPLDTGKTFTVTQNVKSDESIKRPSSEFKGGSVAEEGATVKPAGTTSATA